MIQHFNTYPSDSPDEKVTEEIFVKLNYINSISGDRFTYKKIISLLMVNQLSSIDMVLTDGLEYIKFT